MSLLQPLPGASRHSPHLQGWLATGMPAMRSILARDVEFSQSGDEVLQIVLANRLVQPIKKFVVRFLKLTDEAFSAASKAQGFRSAINWIGHPRDQFSINQSIDLNGKIRSVEAQGRRKIFLAPSWVLRNEHQYPILHGVYVKSLETRGKLPLQVLLSTANLKSNRGIEAGNIQPTT